MSFNAEVIAIGEELLAGFTINSNAAVMGRELTDLGFSVNHQQVVGDRMDDLLEAFQRAAGRADVVLVCGGLGPTCDDCTREAVVRFFGGELAFREEVFADLKRRFGERRISLENQATIPSAATPLLNTVGTAPGLLFEKEKRLFFFLPGVPIELKEMVAVSVLPHLKERFPQLQKRLFRKLHLFQLPESHAAPLVGQLNEQFDDLQVGSYPSNGILTLRFSSKEDEAALETAVKAVERDFGDRLFHSPSGTIEEALLHLFTERKLTLATAESCTGGSIAGALTAWPGSSRYFLGSVVAYDNSVKQKLLSVSEESLAKEGAVSETVVRQMAEGARKAIGSDYAVATSGVAGPDGGSEEKPVGTVWTAIAGPGGVTHARKLSLKGNRESVIRRTVAFLLSDLWRSVNG